MIKEIEVRQGFICARHHSHVVYQRYSYSGPYLLYYLEQSVAEPDLRAYFGMIGTGASALPVMKALYSPAHHTPLVGLPPEMVERVFMYCTEGRLSIQEVRRLYPAGVLLGMQGITDREIAHHAVVTGMQPQLSKN